jgi:8-oxo-dGTP diphosphatase
MASLQGLAEGRTGGNRAVKRVHVAAAVIRDNSGNILIARRADTQHQGGLWEFPGGKVEADESVETALARELHEELGIVVGAARPLIKVRHDYPDKQVLLDVWEVSAFTGEPHGAEGQPLAWVSARELSSYEFPEANRPIVAAAGCPSST